MSLSNDGVNTTAVTIEEMKESLTEAEPTVMSVYMKVPNLAITFLFAINFVVFPGVYIAAGMEFIKNINWSIWFVITIFVVFDSVG